VEALYSILDLFNRETVMQINERKYTLSVYNMEDPKFNFYHTFFPFELEYFDTGLNYLGSHMKPNYYRKEYWHWLIEKMEK
jgi:hypothetical protein